MYLFVLLALLFGCQKDETLNWMIIVRADQVSLTEKRLELNVVNLHMTSFLTEPKRVPFLVPLAEFVSGWSANFPEPPLATLAFFSEDGDVETVSLQLSDPQLTPPKLTFEVVSNGAISAMEGKNCVLFFREGCVFQCSSIDREIR